MCQNYFAADLHSHFADKPRFPHVNEEANNAEAVKIFLNGLTPQKVAEQLTLVDAVSNDVGTLVCELQGFQRKSLKLFFSNLLKLLFSNSLNNCQLIFPLLTQTLSVQNLFLRVISHHCLTAVRSPKEKPASVKATIDQFNRVVYCVLALCLCPGLKSTQRAKIISRWVEVAQVRNCAGAVVLLIFFVTLRFGYEAAKKRFIVFALTFLEESDAI